MLEVETANGFYFRWKGWEEGEIKDAKDTLMIIREVEIAA